MFILLLLNIVSGIMLILIAIPKYLKKIPPNLWYGFRVRKTLENPELWYLVNSYSGGWFIICGLVTIICAIGLYFLPGLSVDVYALLCTGVFVVISTIGLAFTMRYMGSLPGGK
jgi:uncharacterized membrane protein